MSKQYSLVRNYFYFFRQVQSIRNFSLWIVRYNNILNVSLALNRFKGSIDEAIQVEEWLNNGEIIVFKFGKIKEIIDQIQQHAGLILHSLRQIESLLQIL